MPGFGKLKIVYQSELRQNIPSPYIKRVTVIITKKGGEEVVVTLSNDYSAVIYGTHREDLAQVKNYSYLLQNHIIMKLTFVSGDHPHQPLRVILGQSYF